MAGGERPALSFTYGADMEKRKFQRMAMCDLSVDISDGVGSFPGVVSDVSRFGIGLKDLPKKINMEAKRMTVVISGQGGHFKMYVRPKWSVAKGLEKDIGVEISNAPWGWTEFVMGFEPVFNDDIWGEIHL